MVVHFCQVIVLSESKNLSCHVLQMRIGCLWLTLVMLPRTIRLPGWQVGHIALLVLIDLYVISHVLLSCFDILQRWCYCEVL